MVFNGLPVLLKHPRPIRQGRIKHRPLLLEDPLPLHGANLPARVRDALRGEPEEVPEHPGATKSIENH